MKRKLVSILLILSVGSVCMACGLEQATDNGPKSLLGGSKDVEETTGDEENNDDVKIEVVEGRVNCLFTSRRESRRTDSET